MIEQAVCMELNQIGDLSLQIREIIEFELRPRLKSFDVEIELLEINDEIVKVAIKKIRQSLFDVRREVIEKIVVCKIKTSIAGIRKVIVVW
ncbi:MAG: hypothetical protein HPY50_20995 [Firmicutes bacterium]|nr:hypothetical protein [Bacillota bacterium]